MKLALYHSLLIWSRPKPRGSKITARSSRSSLHLSSHSSSNTSQDRTFLNTYVGRAVATTRRISSTNQQHILKKHSHSSAAKVRLVSFLFLPFPQLRFPEHSPLCITSALLESIKFLCQSPLENLSAQGFGASDPGITAQKVVDEKKENIRSEVSALFW